MWLRGVPRSLLDVETVECLARPPTFYMIQTRLEKIYINIHRERETWVDIYIYIHREREIDIDIYIERERDIDIDIDIYICMYIYRERDCPSRSLKADLFYVAEIEINPLKYESA